MIKYRIPVLRLILLTLVFSLFIIFPGLAWGLGDGQRLAGQDRYATAASVAQQGWQKSYTAILVNGQEFADALCSGPLARKYAAPILLTERDRLPEQSLQELKRLETKHVILVGGPAAIASAIKDSLRQAGVEKIERIGGQDRLETSVLVAQRVNTSGTVVLASAQSPWDALAVGTIAAHEGFPIVLTDRDQLAPSVLIFLQEKNIIRTFVIGGTGVIASSLEEELPGAVRIGGRDRFATNALILKEFQQELDYGKVYAVTGESGTAGGFTDALSVAPLAGMAGNPLILTSGKVPAVLKDCLPSRVSVASKLVVVGGKTVAPEEIFREFAGEVGKVERTTLGEAGVFGADESSRTINGNLVISADGVILQDTIIEGDLLLAGSIGQGTVQLRDVTVKGTTTINGGGPHSVILDNFNGEKVVVDIPDGESIRLVAQGSTGINQIRIYTNGILQEEDLSGSGFQNVEILQGAGVLLSGGFDRVDVNGGGSDIPIPAGTSIQVLNLNAAAAVSGQGAISQANINCSGTSLEQRPGSITIGEGVTTTVAGQQITQPVDNHGSQGQGTSNSGGASSIPGYKVTAVGANIADGCYKTGDVIEITVTFSGNVDITGTPVLELETGDTDREARYSEGTGSPVLTFVYEVQVGDSSADLNYKGTDALRLKGGTIRNAGKNIAAVLTLPDPAGAGSLQALKDLVIDARPPKAIAVSGQNILAGNSSLTLTVVDGPLSDSSWAEILSVIQANTGTGENWISGIAGTDLTLTPAEDGATAKLANHNAAPGGIGADFVIPAVKLVDRAGNYAISDIVIDSNRPVSVIAVKADTADGFYKAGDNIELKVVFSDEVDVIGTPLLYLATGTPDRAAVYNGGTGTVELNFAYTVQAGDTASPLDYAGTDSLELNGGTIKARYALADTLTELAEPGEEGSIAGNHTIIFDTEAPSAIQISIQSAIPANGSLTLTAVGGPLSDASWMEIFNVIKANTGAGDNWIIGLTADDLSLTPAAGGLTAILENHRNSPAGVAADFVIGAAKVVDRAGNVAEGDIIVDSYAPATVTSVSASNADGYYKEGDSIEILVNFSRIVSVSGSPVLYPETGGTGREAIYSGGSGTTTLAFTYTVQAGDNSPCLDYPGEDALDLRGGTIKDYDNLTDVSLTLPEPGEAGSLAYEKNIIVDTAPPAVVAISQPNSIAAGGSVTLLATGGPLTDASWAAILQEIQANTAAGENWISGVSAGDLSITPSAGGDSALLANSNAAMAAINADFLIPAAGVRDRAGNTASGDITIDAYVMVRVSGVSSASPDGYYKAGDTITIQVCFDGEVTNEGSYLYMNLGAVTKTISCTGGSGTAVLTYEYQVKSSENSADLDYTSTTALKGTIKVKGTSIDAEKTLPVPGEEGSLGRNKDIIVDNTPPSAMASSAQNEIPAGGSLLLTATDGPLSTDSWNAILNTIQANTASGHWLTGIAAEHLTIAPSAGGSAAALQNGDTAPAIILKDFIIPAAQIVDKAGNVALEDMRINTLGSGSTDLAVTDGQIIYDVTNDLGAEDLYVAYAQKAGQVKGALYGADDSPQTYVITNSAGNPKGDTSIVLAGDQLVVTSENGMNQRSFPIRIAPQPVTTIQVKAGTPNADKITIDNTSGSEKYMLDGILMTAGEVKASLESTDGSSQTYTVIDGNGGELSDGMYVSGTVMLVVTAYDGVTQKEYTIWISF